MTTESQGLGRVRLRRHRNAKIRRLLTIVDWDDVIDELCKEAEHSRETRGIVDLWEDIDDRDEDVFQPCLTTLYDPSWHKHVCGRHITLGHG